MIPAWLAFVGRNLRSSFRSEKMTHLLTLSTVWISLVLVGGVELLQSNLSMWAEQWASERTVAVFVDPEAGASQRDTIQKEAQNRGINDGVWTDPAASALSLAKLLGVDQPTTLQQFTPWVYEGSLDPTAVTAEVQNLGQLDQVLLVDMGTVVAEKIDKISGQLARGGLLLSIVLLLATFLVVSNTIGLALTSRQDEIEIMDLVGTPIAWIYIAFVTEGILIGLLGGGLAVITLGVPLEHTVFVWLQQLGMPVAQSISSSQGTVMLGIGATIGIVASWRSVRRYLHDGWGES